MRSTPKNEWADLAEKSKYSRSGCFFKVIVYIFYFGTLVGNLGAFGSGVSAGGRGTDWRLFEKKPGSEPYV